MSKIRVITFGTYDLFHIGHLNILERAKELGDELIVGISTDKLNYSKKKKYPIYSQEDRSRIVNAMEIVDEVFYEESLELKREYILKYNADILVMGNDWEGKFDEFNDICKVVYLERTASISTTEIVEVIRSNK
jgi:glycerol-3-phosphate cytidylyltransferase